MYKLSEINYYKFKIIFYKINSFYNIRLDNWNYGYNIEDEDLILHLAKIE